MISFRANPFFENRLIRIASPIRVSFECQMNATTGFDTLIIRNRWMKIKLYASENSIIPFSPPIAVASKELIFTE